MRTLAFTMDGNIEYIARIKLYLNSNSEYLVCNSIFLK